MLENTLSDVSFPNIFNGKGGGGGGTPMPPIPPTKNGPTHVQCVLRTPNPQLSKYKLLTIFVPRQFFRACYGPVHGVVAKKKAERKSQETSPILGPIHFRGAATAAA